MARSLFASFTPPPPESTQLFLRPARAESLTVGSYRVEQEIGRGAVGIIYRAVHQLLGTPAAVKVLKDEFAVRPDARARFVTEARAAAALRHPNIVQLFDLVSLPDGRPAIVMEYLEGESLEQCAGRSPMPPERARALLQQLCSALAAVHQQGIVHRDLKAQNVMIVKGTEPEQVKLLDFGLAKLDAGETSSGTPPGTWMGTPHYMAPEQILGGPVDRRADVYALGVLGYRLLTGVVPFAGAPSQVMFQHVHAAPQEPLNVPPALRRVLLKALAKKREERFQDMEQFAQALAEPPPKPVHRAPFTAAVNGGVITLRFVNEEAFRHVERHELAKGRVFVPGTPPASAGLLSVVVEIPKKPVREAPVTLLGTFGREAAAKHGIPEGFVLGLKAPLRERAAAVPVVVLHKPRSRRFPQRLPVSFGLTAGTQYTGTTVDISPRGLGLRSPFVLPVGLTLVLTVTLPSQQTAQVQGRIVWSRKDSGERGGIAGLRLTRMEQPFLDLVASLLRDTPQVEEEIVTERVSVR